MKKLRLWQMILFEIIIFLGLLYSANITQAVTNNSVKNIDSVMITKVPTLRPQVQQEQLFIPSIDNLSIVNILDDTSSKDPYLNVYTNYETDGKTPSAQQDLTLSPMTDSDGNVGYVAHVFTPRGLLEAIYDPANPGWNFNHNNTGNWRTDNLETPLQLAIRGAGSNYCSQVSKIHEIDLENDIDLTAADANTVYQYNLLIPNNNTVVPGNERYRYVNIRHDKMVIDGGPQHHFINVGDNNIALVGTKIDSEDVNTPYKEDWTLKNLDAYVANYWGIVSANTGYALNYDNPQLKQSGLMGGYTWLTYDNVYYVGSQFTWSEGSTTGVSIVNTVAANSVYSYKVPNNPHLWLTQGAGSQQNFQINNVVFEKKSHFYGNTFSGNSLELKGKATVKDGAVVDLYPHGYYGGTGNTEDSENYLSWGLYFQSGTPTLDLYGDSQLNIHCEQEDIDKLQGDGNNLIQRNGTFIQGVTRDQEVASHTTQHPHLVNTAAGVDMLSSDSKLSYHAVNDKYPQINVYGNGRPRVDGPLVKMMGGSVNLSHGKFNIVAKNLGGYSNGVTGGLMMIGSTRISVKTGGDFNISIGDKNNDKDAAVNLLYAASSINVYIMNPKNVSLDLRNDNCNNSSLVYIGTGGADHSGADIKAFDTRVSAWGDNKAQTIGASKGVNTNTPKIVSLGMGDHANTPTPSGTIAGTISPDPVRVQQIVLPFTFNAIVATLYLNGQKVIQAPDAELKILKNAMADMNGKEFRYIRLSDLPGPSLDKVTEASDPYNSTIKGIVGGDLWANEHETDTSLFIPQPPKLRVQVKRADGTAIDLGTVENSDAANQKADKDAASTAVNQVTPNLIDNDGDLNLTSDGTSPNLGHPITGKEKPPQYLDDSKVTWDNGSWNSQNINNHKFSYDLQKLIDDYNQHHLINPIHLKSTDTILTSIVTNYQSSPIISTKVVNLYLDATASTKDYLIGDTISVPVMYEDGDIDSKHITLTGKIDGHNIPDTTINNLPNHNKVNNYDWHIAGQTTTSGQHQLVFAGDDGIGNKTEHDITWNYNVLNLPAYSGELNIPNNPYSKRNEILGGKHELNGIFVPKGNAPLRTVQFSHDNGADSPNWSIESAQIRASYPDSHNSQQRVQSNWIDFKLNSIYQPSDFNWGNQDFPKGTIFEIKRYVKITANKNVPVNIGKDSIATTSDGKTINLGSSNSLQYNTLGLLELKVPTIIDFGQKKTSTAEELHIKKISGDPLEIINETSGLQNVSLDAEASGNDTLFDKELFYKDTANNIHPLNSPYQIYSNSKLTSSIVNISHTWNLSNGPIMKVPQNSSLQGLGKRRTQITWTLTYGP